MSPIEKQLASGALLALAALLDDPANAAVAESMIASGEGAITAGIVTLAKDVPEVKGALSMLEGPLLAAGEAAVENSVTAFFAKEPPASMVAAASAWMKSAAAKVAA
jgi:hypothetical protein